MSQRDLSAFLPPPRGVAVPAPGRDRSPGLTVARARVADARRKVMTSLPAPLHRRLREVAEGESRFKGDLVLEALRAHGSSIERDSNARPLRRRRRVEDATQCQLYLTDTERSELDSLGELLGMSRSALVTALLELALDADSMQGSHSRQ
ncbi:MAG: hypothetical protein ACRDV9_03920 [Acidimicrobiia bacterium]